MKKSLFIYFMLSMGILLLAASVEAAVIPGKNKGAKATSLKNREKELQEHIQKSVKALSKEGVGEGDLKRHINPLTGLPYIAVRNGDFIDAIIFITEYRYFYSEEKAELILEGDSPGVGGGVTVLFTHKGEKVLYSNRMGFEKIGERKISVSDIQEQMKYRRQKSLEQYLKANKLKYKDWKPQNLWAMDLLPSEIAKELPAEANLNPFVRAAAQTERVFNRLRAMDIPVTKPRKRVHVETLPQEYKDLPYGLSVEWEGKVFYWDSLDGQIYLGTVPPDDIEDRTIACIQFVEKFKKEFLKEKMVLHIRPRGSAKADGTNFAYPIPIFTKHGKVYVWVHNIGELEIPIAPRDMADFVSCDRVVRETTEKQKVKKHKGRIPESRKWRDAVEEASIPRVKALLDGMGIHSSVSPKGDRLFFSYNTQDFYYTPELGTRFLSKRNDIKK